MAKHCVLVSVTDWRSIRAFQRDGRSKILWRDLGSRCFGTKAAAVRYAQKMSRYRPGRARISVDVPTIPEREWRK